MANRWWWAAVVWTAGLGACDRTYGDCYGSMEPSDAAVVNLGDGELAFDWSFGTAYAVSVVDDEGREVWHVQCGGDNLEDDARLERQVCIETPLVYGERVDSPFFDDVNFVRPKPLEAGRTYHLLLATLIEEDGPAPEPEPGSFAALIGWSPDDRERASCGRGFTGEVDFVAP